MSKNPISQKKQNCSYYTNLKDFLQSPHENDPVWSLTDNTLNSNLEEKQGWLSQGCFLGQVSV